MKRGITLYCAMSLPILYLTISGLNSAIGFFIFIGLVSLIIVLIIKVFKKDWQLSTNFKIWSIILVSAFVYLSINLLVVAWWLPHATPYSETDLYIFSYVWLATVIIIDLLIVKKCFVEKLNFWCKLIIILAIIAIIFGMVLGLLKLSSSDKARSQTALKNSNTFNPAYFNNLPTLGCGGFKLY